jgi:hypothetical protein
MPARPRPPLAARARLRLLFLGLALATLGLLAAGAWLAALPPSKYGLAS